MLLALRLNAQPIMTVPTMKNVTIQREARERNVFHCVWSLVVSLEQFVQPTITMKNVPADHLLREMVMFLALNLLWLRNQSAELTKTALPNLHVYPRLAKTLAQLTTHANLTKDVW